MCKTVPYITLEFCDKYNIIYRTEVAEYTKVPIALGMCLAHKINNYGTAEWKERFEKEMMNIYLHDCKLYDKHKKDDEDWLITRKIFYDEEGYP